MLIEDSLLYIITFAFSLFFTILTFLPQGDDFEENISKTGFSIGMLPAVMRIAFFPLISAIGWGTLSIFSLTLNNCSQTFDTCYDSPLFNSIGVAIDNPFGVPLAIIFMLLSIMMIVMSVAIIFTLSGIMMTAMKDRRAGV